MFDEQRKKIEKNLKDLEKEREELDAEEQTYKQKLKDLDDLEKDLLSKGAKDGRQSFTLYENDFTHIDKDFINKANKWIASHEQEHHPARFYNVEDDNRYRGAVSCSNYSVNLMWTSIGRLVSIECEECKKKSEDEGNNRLEYLYCDEA